MDVMVESLRTARKIVQSPRFAKYAGKEVIDTTIPHDPESREYLEEFVRRTSNTVYHPVRCTAVLVAWEACPHPRTAVWHVPHGQSDRCHHSCRPTVPRGGNPRPARRRRQHHPARHQRQHECAMHHGRREGGRHDQGGLGGACVNVEIMPRMLSSIILFTCSPPALTNVTESGVLRGAQAVLKSTPLVGLRIGCAHTISVCNHVALH